MNKPRDLTATPETTADAVERHENSARWAVRKAESSLDDPHQYSLLEVPSHMARGLLQRYARGDSLAALYEYFHTTYLPMRQQAIALSARFFPDHRLRMHVEQPASWMLLFALLCFDDDGAEMAQLDNWFTPDGNPVLYAMVRKAIDPGFRYAGQYDLEHRAVPHEEPLVAALLQPHESWASAFGAYMQQWPKLMKKFGYREHVEEGRSRFDYFPLHLGLAVCAFDIDDSAFRDLPYYPHELVDHYRSHQRHTRDAWRTGAVDPAEGLPDSARPQPKKTYALSKGEAYARWIELVCGEQPALVKRAKKALGKRKSMPPLDTLMAALAAAGLAIHADLKDDDSVQAQAAALCQSWQLAPPAADGKQGPARITAILNDLQERDRQQGQCLAVFDDGGDNWHAAFYRSEHDAEFATLCEQLGLKRMARSGWQ